MTAETQMRPYADYVTDWLRVDSAANWAKGDILAELVTSYGEQTLAKFADDVGKHDGDHPLKLNTCQELRRVAVAFPEKSRRLDIPWSVHQVFAAQDDRAELIAAFSGTVADARRLVAGRRAEAPQSRDLAAEAEIAAQRARAEAIRKAKEDKAARSAQRAGDKARQAHEADLEDMQDQAGGSWRLFFADDADLIAYFRDLPDEDWARLEAEAGKGDLREDLERKKKSLVSALESVKRMLEEATALAASLRKYEKSLNTEEEK